MWTTLRLLTPRTSQTLASHPLRGACRQERCITRYSHRTPGSGRLRPRSDSRHRRPANGPEVLLETLREEERNQPKAVGKSSIWNANAERSMVTSGEGLKVLLSQDTLIVTRELEMLNVFMGFEQSNKYSITNEAGEVMGYIAEEPRGLLATLSRQIFRTHRPFRALIMDKSGSPVLWLRRPFAWINSRMYIQKLQNPEQIVSREDPILETFAEVQQRWHLWRRRYDLFLREPHGPRIISRIDDKQPEPEPIDENFNQFASIDGGFWAWNFVLCDARGLEMASVNRAFRGFGREIFTDTGQYFVRFAPSPNNEMSQSKEQRQVSNGVRRLTLEEKALVLALSVNVDFDYFSRHSQGGHTGFFFWGGGDE